MESHVSGGLVWVTESQEQLGTGLVAASPGLQNRDFTSTIVRCNKRELAQVLICASVAARRYRPGGFGDRPNPQAGGGDAAKKA